MTFPLEMSYPPENNFSKIGLYTFSRRCPNFEPYGVGVISPACKDSRVEILEPWGAEEEMQTQFKTTL